MGVEMDDWHNMTVQGQKNTAVSKNMKRRAAYAFTKWNRERKKEGLPAAVLVEKKTRIRRRRW
jgi:hypothetical protein